jgi:hypothetical protein
MDGADEMPEIPLFMGQRWMRAPWTNQALWSTGSLGSGESQFFGLFEALFGYLGTPNFVTVREEIQKDGKKRKKTSTL